MHTCCRAETNAFCARAQRSRRGHGGHGRTGGQQAESSNRKSLRADISRFATTPRTKSSPFCERSWERRKEGRKGGPASSQRRGRLRWSINERNARTAVDESDGWGEGGREEWTVWRRRRSLSRGSAADAAVTAAAEAWSIRSGAEGAPWLKQAVSMRLALSPSLS